MAFGMELEDRLQYPAVNHGRGAAGGPPMPIRSLFSRFPHLPPSRGGLSGGRIVGGGCNLYGGLKSGGGGVLLAITNIRAIGTICTTPRRQIGWGGLPAGHPPPPSVGPCCSFSGPPDCDADPDRVELFVSDDDSRRFGGAGSRRSPSWSPWRSVMALLPSGRFTIGRL